MKLLDLFSGIGGFSLAAHWVWGKDLEIVGFCEIDNYCKKVLNKNFPGVPIYDDIKKLRGTDFGAVELITGGDPCQPYSVAGKRKGKEDNRYLWPEMFRIIQETHPNWIVNENVVGSTDMVLDKKIADLESEGYEIRPFNIPACAINAKHQRQRIWLIANDEKQINWEHNTNSSYGQIQQLGECFSKNNVADSKSGKSWKQTKQKRWKNISGRSEKKFNASNATKQGLERKKPTGKSWEQNRLFTECDWWTTEPELGRVVNGIPNRVDRLKGLGNAIVPQVAMVIMAAIKEIEALDLGGNARYPEQQRVT